MVYAAGDSDPPESPWIETRCSPRLEEKKIRCWKKYIESGTVRSLFGQDNVSQLAWRGIPAQVRGPAWQWLLRIEQIRQRYSTTYFHDLAALPNSESPNYSQIRLDLPRTFPDHPHFDTEDQKGQASMFRVLKAYSLHDRQTGYCQGMSYLAGVLLIHMPEETHLVNYFDVKLSGLQAVFAQTRKALKCQIPNLVAHLEGRGICLEMYATPWFMSLFTTSFENWSAIFRIWDAFFCDGVAAIQKVVLALHKLRMKSLLGMDGIEELLPVLQHRMEEGIPPDLLMSHAEHERPKWVTAAPTPRRSARATRQSTPVTSTMSKAANTPSTASGLANGWVGWLRSYLGTPVRPEPAETVAARNRTPLRSREAQPGTPLPLAVRRKGDAAGSNPTTSNLALDMWPRKSKKRRHAALGDDAEPKMAAGGRAQVSSAFTKRRRTGTYAVIGSAESNDDILSDTEALRDFVTPQASPPPARKNAISSVRSVRAIAGVDAVQSHEEVEMKSGGKHAVRLDSAADADSDDDMSSVRLSNASPAMLATPFSALSPFGSPVSGSVSRSATGMRRRRAQADAAMFTPMTSPPPAFRALSPPLASLKGARRPFQAPELLSPVRQEL